MRAEPLWVLALVVVLGCGADPDGGSPPVRPDCDALRDQIMALLQTKVQAGVLIETAIPCGADGVASHPEYFESQQSEAVIDALSRDFEARCTSYAECVATTGI